ncbi:MAG: hypothetical protein IKA99_07190 [Clostridia bacterium]|nr:hypothetical protein [Clostridia bacterium]
MKAFIVTDYGVKKDFDGLQTKEFQYVLDLCKENGGRVVVPKGKYYISSVMMWSNTTLYLEAGAEIYGSDNCEDYLVFDVPEGVEMRSDMELITQYYGKPWDTYRRAMISCYGQKNVSIIGEAGSIIDEQHCYDANGEENYRGPHIIFFTCCENVLFEGYTARFAGNFMHEANNCRNLTMRKVTCLGGSDGIHLHFTENALIEDCLFKTGDDCIAGINVKNLHVNRCIMNTSCNLFRMGGTDILIEKCYAYGPGYYPHRMTVVKGKNNELPREEGRHNLLYMLDHFASSNYPSTTPSKIVFKDCVIENAKGILFYLADHDELQKGAYLGELILDNVRFVDLHEHSFPKARPDYPLTIKMKNVSTSFVKDCQTPRAFTLVEDSFTTIVEE